MKREPIYRKAVLAIIAALCFMLPTAGAQSLDKGLHLLDMDQFHNAAAFFKDITKQAPTNSDAWYYLGLTYCDLGNADSASIAFNAGVTADPKNPANFSGQAMVMHLKNNDVQAKAMFVTASKMRQKKYPNGLITILRGYALCKYPVNEFIDGVYKDAQAADLKNPNIYLRWGDIEYNAKDYGAASLAYTRAATYDDKNVLAHYLLGQMYNAARNNTAALVELDAALAIDPMFVPAIKVKGDAYYDSEKYDQAAIWYDKYIQLTEETIPSLTRYANVLFLAKKYDKTHDVIAKVLKLEPNNPYMLRLMGWVSYETNNDADGISALARYFQIKGDTAKMILPLDYDYYAKLLQRTGKDSLAVIYFQKSMAADSSNLARRKLLLETISDLYYKQNKKVEAASYLERTRQFKTGIDGVLENKIGNLYKEAALELIPPVTDTLQRKAFLLNPSPAFLDLLVKADSSFSKVCQSNPTIFLGFVARARIANLLDPDGTKGLAKPYYEKTIELAMANNPEAKGTIIEGLQYLVSQAYYAYVAAGKDKEKSAQAKAQLIEILNKIIAVDPGNAYATANLKLLTAPAKKTTGTK
jgi:tetratricopeptide (TPR) repeat protein